MRKNSQRQIVIGNQLSTDCYCFMCINLLVTFPFLPPLPTSVLNVFSKKEVDTNKCKLFVVLMPVKVFDSE